MEFFSGMIVGSVLTIVVAFGFKFYSRTEKKDVLIADSLGKEFKEEIRLEEKKK